MLIFLRHNLAFLAVPKTGTTAIEMALKPKAEIIFAKRRKHLTAQKFRNKIVPFVGDAFGRDLEGVAVMRHPIEQIRSWYRYRSNADLDGTEYSTADMSFDEFVSDVIADTPPPHAGIGSQFAFLTGTNGKLLVNHLFAYEAQLQFRGFMSERLGTKLELKPKNVSPAAQTPLSHGVEAKLRAARAEEFALYDHLIAEGGYLRTPLRKWTKKDV
ncbi:MAG: hypothetical protein ACSHWZ_03925 [Sulfitobacter sp.]